MIYMYDDVKVEVRLREGRGVNVHMYCAWKPGILLSTMRALDEIGLDIQQAVISCFNGFSLDVFRAEVCLVCTILSLVSLSSFILSSLITSS